MPYRGNPSKPVPLPKICISRNLGYNGPQPYIYGILAKQPGNDYKIRLRDMERTRMERLRVKYEDDFKNLIKHTVHKKMIDVADRKCLYNQIKNMVECRMKANEHLFLDECTKTELKEEEQPPEQPKITVDDLLEKAEELKKKDNEEERKLVEEKRLQMFINSSEELRSAAMAKRKKDIADINYKIIQEKERVIKEQITKKRELDNIKNLEIFKMQNFEKEEERRTCLMRKQQFRKELYEQVQEKEVIRQLEKELKIVECNELKMLNEKLNKEEELEKLQSKQKKIQRNEEIKRFIKEREKLFSKMHDGTNMFNETLTSTMQQILRDDAEDAKEAKMQLRREDEMYKKHHAMIVEERKRQSEEISKTVMKQIDEIQSIKRSIEFENAEAQRKRAENGKKALIEQIKTREKLLEQQKDTKRKAYEQSMKEYEEYLEEERQLCEKKKQFKWQVRKDLNDQINFRKNIIEKQRKIDLENHQKCMKEFAEQEKLLEQLLNEIRTHHM